MRVETVVPYLVLDKTYAERAEFEGAKFVMSPPLRERRHQNALWKALAAGQIDTVATDHAPFDFVKQKEMGRGDFTKIPNGIPSVQDRVHLLYTHGVATGRIDLHRFVDAAATQAAKIFGLFPRKGTIQPGADADLVDFRSAPSRRHLGEDTANERGLQRFRGLADPGPRQNGDRARQGAGAGWPICRGAEPWADAETRIDAWGVIAHRRRPG